MADECKHVVNIVKGRKKTFFLNLKKDGNPRDLTSVTDIEVVLPNSSSESLTLTGAEVSILNAAQGRIQVDVPAAKSANLTVGDEQTIEVAVKEGAGEFDGTQIEEAVTVVASLKS